MSVSIADYFLIFNDELFYIAFNCKVLQPEGKVTFKLAQVSVEILVTGAYFRALHTQSHARVCAFVYLVLLLRIFFSPP